MQTCGGDPPHRSLLPPAATAAAPPAAKGELSGRKRQKPSPQRQLQRDGSLGMRLAAGP